MFKNYLKIAARNLWQNKTFSVIKIFGLSIGLMVCMLIFLYTKDEVSYDQFHVNKRQLHRITQTWQMGGDIPQPMAITNAVMGEAFKKEIPEVQQYTRINGYAATVKKGNDVFTESPLFVDANFFSVFSFPLLKGSGETVLNDFHSLVLSEEAAKKYFGTTDAVGKTMQLKFREAFENFIVTGIAENAPQNSSIKFTILLPFQYYLQHHNRNTGWVGGSMNTFLLLSPQANIKTVESKMQAVFDQNAKEELAKAKEEQGMSLRINLNLQPLTSIHLSPKTGAVNGLSDSSSPTYSYMLTCIAIFILIVACINFINLALAQSLKRSKEIGIRKVVGSSRTQLIKQFLTESFLVSLVAFLIAFFLTILVLPLFNQLANKKLSLSYLSDGYLYAGYFILLLFTAFIAGFYPSLVLSSFQPVKVLYSRQKITGKNYLTKGLIVLQFALAIFLIIGTIGINTQLKFLLHKDLGYDSKSLVGIDLPFGKESNKLPAVFKNELAGNASILGVATRNRGRNMMPVKMEDKTIPIEYNKIDDQFLPLFKIPIIAGRNFLPASPSDSFQSVIVNKRFVTEAGLNLKNVVGKTLTHPGDPQNRRFTIVGVIQDYHFSSLKEKITPALFTMDSSMSYGQVWVKIRPDNVPQTLSLLEATYKKLIPYFPYSYQFMDDINARNYETEQKWKQIINISSVLFLFISCIGLLGLVILSIEQRTKEIGIRKVLGAAVSRIMVLISREFIVLIVIAFVVAVPAGYYAIHQWLQDFAYRIPISWWMFALAGSSVIVIALLTMGFQTLKAAMANPVKNLRTE